MLIFIYYFLLNKCVDLCVMLHVKVHNIWNLGKGTKERRHTARILILAYLQ